MADTAAVRVKRSRERKKMLGMIAVNMYLDRETKNRFDVFAAKTGGQAAAIRKLLDSVAQASDSTD
jgi:hypothetical protein